MKCKMCLYCVARPCPHTQLYIFVAKQPMFVCHIYLIQCTQIATLNLKPSIYYNVIKKLIMRFLSHFCFVTLSVFVYPFRSGTLCTATPRARRKVADIHINFLCICICRDTRLESLRQIIVCMYVH